MHPFEGGKIKFIFWSAILDTQRPNNNSKNSNNAAVLFTQNILSSICINKQGSILEERLEINKFVKNTGIWPTMCLLMDMGFQNDFLKIRPKSITLKCKKFPIICRSADRSEENLSNKELVRAALCRRFLTAVGHYFA